VGYDLPLWCLGCWFVICFIRASRDRTKLGDKYYVHATGQNELHQISTFTHALYLMLLRSPLQLYGPFIQSNTKLTNFDSRWWKVYYQVYLMLTMEEKRRVRKAMFKIGFTLEGAIEHVTRFDVDGMIGGKVKPLPDPVFSMTEAAEEYDQIISMQESVK